MSPSDHDVDHEAQREVKERPVGDTAEKQRGDNTKTQTSGMSAHCLTSPSLIYLLAENYGDPSGKVWSMYLTEAKKEDDQITKSWTEDTGGYLVFVSFKTSFYICSMPKPKR